jgi:hypothetical protein
LKLSSLTFLAVIRDFDFEAALGKLDEIETVRAKWGEVK